MHFEKKFGCYMKSPVGWYSSGTTWCVTITHGREARQTSKPKDSPLFDVELYLTMHKSFV